MEIRKQRIGDVLELEIQGRLDGYWADHLSQSLDDVAARGTGNLRFNLSPVSHLSSAGIRLLGRAHDQSSAFQASRSVSAPSEAVRSILELTGMMDLLVPGVTPGLKAESSGARIL